MYKRERFAGRRLLLALIDAGIAAGVGMVWMRHASGSVQMTTSLALVVATLAPLTIAGAYVQVLRTSLSSHRFWVGVSSCSSIAGAKLVLSCLGIVVAAGTVASAGILLFVLLLSVRVVLLRLHAYFFRQRRLWVVAEDEVTARMIASKVASHGDWYEIVGWSAMREVEQLSERLASCDAVLCTPALRELLESACAQFRKELMIVPGSSEVLLATAMAHRFDDLLVFSVAPPGLTGLQRFWKRVLDVVGAALLLWLFAPVLFVLYLVIPLQSSGPAIYRQRRRGWHGSSFEVLKFRTMTMDAERNCGPVLAVSEDPRVTALGRWLRAIRLDELPQLWNVLKGEMSLVGPRPEREHFAREFDRELRDYPLRTTVKPGLTGLAQVWGSYSTTAESKLRFDLMYIANYSLLRDIQLLLQTIHVVFQREQAAGIVSGPLPPLGFDPAVDERRQA